MLYKLLINYFRLKLLRIALKSVMGSKYVKSKNLKTQNIILYAIEFITLFLSSNHKKRAKVK